MVHSLTPAALPSACIPLIFGLAVAAMVYATGHISGAHLNPAVTFAFSLTGRFPWKEVPFYWAAQCAGAFAAIALLAFTLPHTANYGATIPTLTIGKAFLWEVILSYFLMFVIIAVATDSRAVGIMAGAAIGAIVALNAFIGGSLTGASMNPARSLAPSVFAGVYDSLWIYITAPMLGAGLAAFTYDAIRCEPRDERKQAKGCC